VSCREAISLDGEWEFQFFGYGTKPVGESAPISVPGVWQVRFPELIHTTGLGVYSRNFAVPSDWAEGRILLRFGGVFHTAELFIDGKWIARHANGWVPFEVDITDAVRPGKSINIALHARVPKEREKTGADFGETLHGKQNWYGLQGGIWLPVTIEMRGTTHLSDCIVTTQTDLSTSTLKAQIKITEPREGVCARLSLTDRRGSLLKECFADASHAQVSLELSLGSVEFWSPESPTLYHARLELLDDTGCLDTFTVQTGFRKLESRDGKLHLNGEEFYMFGVLDQDWYLGDECRFADPEFLRDRFAKAKLLGINCLRCHVKIPDPLYFEIADELGLLVWLDMPYPTRLTARSKSLLEETFQSAASRFGHHASLNIWSIINEGWGIELDDNPSHRAYLLEAFDRLRALVPSSMVVDNSACFPRNFHMKSDLEDFHWYCSWPAQNEKWDHITSQFANRPDWTFSPHGDAVRSGCEPLIVSEFGVWGLPHQRDLLDENGQEPWWFESGYEWESASAVPAGMRQRFKSYNLDKIFSSFNNYIEQAQQTQFRGLKYQIESIRGHSEISGYCVTELNDVQWEANGLMDAANNLRSFAGLFAELQKRTLLLPKAQTASVVTGTDVTVRIDMVDLDGAATGGHVEWSCHEHRGTIPVESFVLENGNVLATATFTIPADALGGISEFTCSLHDAHGAELHRNFCRICHLRPLSPSDTPTGLCAADEGAASILDALGWSHTPDLMGPGVTLVATQMSALLKGHLLAGGNAVLVANGMDALAEGGVTKPQSNSTTRFPGGELVERAGSVWEGNWFGCFAWRRTDGAWSKIPGQAMLDEFWADFAPKYILSGVRGTEFGGLVDAGATVGWVHNPVAIVRRYPFGEGELCISTFDLSTPAALDNPIAPYLMNALIGAR